MSWFFIALLGPFLYALTNYIDKVLLERYFKKSGIGTVLLFSSLGSVFALPFFLLIDRTVLDVSFVNILILAIKGMLGVGVLWCYLIALRDEETSVVIVFYQLVPVFGSILGYLVLGEVLTHMQLISMAIIILGTTIIAFEVDLDNHFKLRKKSTIIPMLGASFFWALGGTIFKLVALKENLWRSLFWENLMFVLVGICIFIFIRSYRENFISAFKSNSKNILSLNVLNESIYISGNVVVAYAYLLAPVGLVLLTQSFQPIFVLFIGVILTVFFPKIIVEKIEAKHIWQKIIAISLTGIGTYLLLFYK
ncbi:MAG: DMT family transporter [Candidatus Moranbacteria bacterium]|nr:DMT family transporter [Candidatus Moranbacteria bacterium]